MKKFILLVLSISVFAWQSGAQEKKLKTKTDKSSTTHKKTVKNVAPAELPPPVQPGANGIPVKPQIGANAPLPLEVQRDLDAQKKNPKGKKSIKLQTTPPPPTPGALPSVMPHNAMAPPPQVGIQSEGAPLPIPTNEPQPLPQIKPTPQVRPTPPPPAGKYGNEKKGKKPTAHNPHEPIPVQTANVQPPPPARIQPPPPLPSNAPPEPQKLVYDNQTVIDPNAGKFNFSEETHDYGTVPEGPTAECDFEFTNVGKKPITIIEAHGSCGCTVPQYSKDPVLPGKKGSIHVIYTTVNHPGIINKEVVVTSNAQQSPMTLHIKGEVKGKAQ